MHPHRLKLLAVALICLVQGCAQRALPSWHEGPTKQTIVSFADRVCDPDSPDHVPQSERIAVFDNDGTLWAEQPAYFQLLFAIDRVKQLAPQHPDWNHTEPFKSVLAGDTHALAAQGEHAVAQLIAQTHAGMTTDEFQATVRDWLRTARHPQLNRPYTQCVYQPMLELLSYFRGRGFKTFIVSGGGIEFLRVFAEEVYGIPPEQVIGSSGKVTFELRDSGAVLIKQPEISFIDDKAGKPVAINLHIGRRPIIAVGNSDGDLQMLQWTDAGDRPSLCLLVHHDDADREWAYDRQSHIGRLDHALDAASANNWTVISMQRDWMLTFPRPQAAARPPNLP